MELSMRINAGAQQRRAAGWRMAMGPVHLQQGTALSTDPCRQLVYLLVFARDKSFKNE